MTEEHDVADISNTAEETVAPEPTEELPQEEADEPAEESVEEVRARLAKAEELANNYKIRAEKAERKAKEPVAAEPKTEPKGGLSYKDTVALTNAKVHEDDVDEVLEYAKFKSISVPEALKSSVIKTLLTERDEQRTTAEATNTSRSRGTSSRVSEEALLSKARKTGELPDSEEDLGRMLDARYKNK